MEKQYRYPFLGAPFSDTVDWDRYTGRYILSPDRIRRKGQKMNNYNIKEAGARIKERRLAAGFTQEQLAEAVGVDRSTIGRIEIGINGCSVDMFVQISIALNTSLDYLILGKTSADRLKQQLHAVIGQLTDIQNTL